MNTGEHRTPWTPLGRTGHDRSPLLERIDTSLCRVLVIEDSASDVALVRAELEDAFDGVQVVATPTLKEGLRRAQNERFDIVLLDLNLPDSRGAETFDTARNAIPNLPIIVLTGLQDAEAERELLSKGAQDYLNKGVDIAPLLVRSMVNAIQRHRLTAERDAWTQQLRESEARTRTIIEANADAIIIVGIDGVIRFVNPTATQMFGRPGNVLLGQHFGFPIAQGQVTELDVRRADGTTGIAEMRVVEMKWGDEPAFLASLRDITEHKRAQEEIRRLNTDLEKRVAERTAELFEAKEKAESSDRFKSAFLASMSHELRTPLNGIIGFSEFLIDTKAGGLNAKQHEYLNDILNSGRHLLQLINNVLDLSKIEAGKMVFSPEPFRVSHALQEVCSVVFPMARRRSIQVRYHVDAEADEVNLDLPKFKQVLYNLISNGVKFNRDRGEVNITVSVIGETTLCLKVRDTGVGIAANDLDKLFKEFQQLDSTRARRHEGSGLGLALTRRIVRLQQGEIMVESTPAVGSTFWVELPRNLERRTE